MPNIWSDLECVIVSFDSSDTLEECIRSLRATCPGASVTVVDNGSQDDSLQLGKALADRVVRLEANYGYAGALNRAIEPCGHPYILVVNPDLRFQDPIDDLMNALETGSDVVGPMLYGECGVQRACARRLPDPFTLLLDQLRVPPSVTSLFRTRTLYFDEWDHLSARNVPALSGACFLLRRDLWTELGGMSEAGFLYFEDLDLFARLQKQEKRVRYIPSVRVFHHGGASSLTVSPEDRIRRFLGAYLLYGIRHSQKSFRWRLTLIAGQLARMFATLPTDPKRSLAYWRRILWVLQVETSELSDSQPLARRRDS